MVLLGIYSLILSASTALLAGALFITGRPEFSPEITSKPLYDLRNLETGYFNPATDYRGGYGQRLVDNEARIYAAPVGEARTLIRRLGDGYSFQLGERVIYAEARPLGSTRYPESGRYPHPRNRFSPAA
jgi:hypothetical protein